MLSLRTIARLAPRSARSISSQCIRATSRLSHQSPLAIRTTINAPLLRSVAAFSTSRIQRDQEGVVNDELAAKLDSELSIEKDVRDSSELPSHLKEFLDNSAFQMEDQTGTEDVVMTRGFGDEKIRINFSIQDLNEAEDDSEGMQEDDSMLDEMDDPADLPESSQSGGANTKGAVTRGRTSGGNMRVATEGRNAPADREELADEEDMEEEENAEPSFPAHLNIVIERPGRGALQFEAIAQDGLIVIEQVYYFKDAKKMEEAGASAAAEMKGDPYTGPPFGNLDEDLQVLFEKYLEERGINTQLALFVPEYIDFKEQREYLGWLSGVKNFVE